MNSKNILAIDTTENILSVVVCADNNILSVETLNSDYVSEEILTLVEKAISNSKLMLEEIDIIAVALGPGSFTGIRSGLSCAKGVALGNKCRLVGVSTLEARISIGHSFNGSVISHIPANARELYFGGFKVDSKLETITPLFDIGFCENSNLKPSAEAMISSIEKSNLDSINYQDVGLAALSGKYDDQRRVGAYWIAHWARMFAKEQENNIVLPLYVKPVHAKTIEERASALKILEPKH